MKLKHLAFALTGLFALAVVGLSLQVSAPDAAEGLLTPAQARELLQSGKVDLVLDVRTPQEYHSAGGHLQGAVLSPIQTLDYNLAQLAPYKNKTVLVYCEAGVRSSQAARILRDKGFTDVLDLYGGIGQWINEGYPTVR
ncbi:MAG: rhodanese-like domain-containing protein [Nitrospinae bacterium]|nr:rhodanese-like domain-containing protein [Nitrospinota bacterium]